MSYRIRHPYGRSAVVATAASTGNTRMIKATIRCQYKKTGGIVAIIAFEGRRYMKFGFADGRYIVMALAAISKHFLVIDKGDNRKSQRCMTSFAVVGDSDVIAYFR